MIECPICRVYWNYSKGIPPYMVNYERCKIKEQIDCISHVASEHSTMIIIERLQKQIEDITEGLLIGLKKVMLNEKL